MFVFSRVCYVTWYNVMGIRVTFQHRSVAFLPVRYIYVCKYRYIGSVVNFVKSQTKVFTEELQGMPNGEKEGVACNE